MLSFGPMATADDPHLSLTGEHVPSGVLFEEPTSPKGPQHPSLHGVCDLPRVHWRKSDRFMKPNAFRLVAATDFATIPRFRGLSLWFARGWQVWGGSPDVGSMIDGATPAAPRQAFDRFVRDERVLHRARWNASRN